jgi:hypothetical protein
VAPPPPPTAAERAAAAAAEAAADKAFLDDITAGSGTSRRAAASAVPSEPSLTVSNTRASKQAPLLSVASLRNFSSMFGIDSIYLLSFAEAAASGWEPVDVNARNPGTGALRITYRLDMAHAHINEDPRQLWRAQKGCTGVPEMYLSIARRINPAAENAESIPFWAVGKISIDKADAKSATDKARRF